MLRTVEGTVEQDHKRVNILDFKMIQGWRYISPNVIKPDWPFVSGQLKFRTKELFALIKEQCRVCIPLGVCPVGNEQT